MKELIPKDLEDYYWQALDLYAHEQDLGRSQESLERLYKVVCQVNEIIKDNRSATHDGPNAEKLEKADAEFSKLEKMINEQITLPE